MTCVRCNQIRFQSLNAFAALRANFREMARERESDGERGGEEQESCHSNCDWKRGQRAAIMLRGYNFRLPSAAHVCAQVRSLVMLLLLWHCLLIELMYTISKQSFLTGKPELQRIGGYGGGCCCAGGGFTSFLVFSFLPQHMCAIEISFGSAKRIEFVVAALALALFFFLPLSPSLLLTVARSASHFLPLRVLSNFKTICSFNAKTCKVF